MRTLYTFEESCGLRSVLYTQKLISSVHECMNETAEHVLWECRRFEEKRKEFPTGDAVEDVWQVIDNRCQRANSTAVPDDEMDSQAYGNGRARGTKKVTR